MKKTSYITTGILILCTIFFIGYFTYAYFTVDQRGNSNIYVRASITKVVTPVFTARTDHTLYLNVDSGDMFAESANTLAASANEKIYISVSGGSTERPVTCTFDFNWATDADSDVYTKTSASDLEYSIEIINSSNKTTTLAETDMNTILNNTSANPIASSSIVSTSETSYQEIYSVTTRFYNINMSQNALSEKTYTGAVYIDNVECSEATS